MNEREVTTSNLNIAAWLLARGFELSRLDQIGPTVFFRFADPQKIGRQVIDSYYSGAEMCIRDFVQGLKTCRDRMFELKRAQRFQGIENEQAQRILGQ